MIGCALAESESIEFELIQMRYINSTTAHMAQRKSIQLFVELASFEVEGQSSKFLRMKTGRNLIVRARRKMLGL